MGRVSLRALSGILGSAALLVLGCGRSEIAYGTGAGTGSADTGGDSSGADNSGTGSSSDGGSSGGSSSGGSAGTGSSGSHGTSGSESSSTTVTQGTNTTAPPCEPVLLENIAAGIGGFVIDGDADQDMAGGAVSLAGDVNGDGLADIVVGASGADPNAHGNAGRAYVVFGKADTDGVQLSEVAQGVGGFAINGPTSGDRAGSAVSGAGDVNGDGIPDVIVGAPYGGPNAGSTPGKTYVVFGKGDTDNVELEDIEQGIGGFVMDGAEQSDYSGGSVGGTGDVNDDGLPDIIVGVGHNSQADRAWVVLGKEDTDPVALADVVQGIGGFAVEGELPASFSAQAVDVAGDVNGDGLSDIIVGAPGVGRAYVAFGKEDTDVVSLADVVQGIGGFVMNGNESEWCASSVSRAGDVNGDGLADVIVGAPQASPNAEGAGQAYVVLGKADTDAVTLLELLQGAGGFFMDGQAEWEYLGVASSGAGDLNDDGLDDIILGTLWGERAYVVFGKIDTDEVSLAAVEQGIGGFLLDGESVGGESGSAVSGGGDVNGDGIPDLVVGAPFADPNGGGSGRAYVVFGSACPGGGG